MNVYLAGQGSPAFLFSERKQGRELLCLKF